MTTSKVSFAVLLATSLYSAAAFVSYNNRIAKWSPSKTSTFRHVGAPILKSTKVDVLESPTTSTESSSIVSNDDPIATIRQLAETAIWNRGCPSGIEALEQLSLLCAQRQPFDFTAQEDKENMDESSFSPKAQSIVSPQRQILPPVVTQGILEQAKEMQQKGWLSTNPDSVDGLPSFHLNLVSGGKPLVDSSSSPDEFEQGLSKMLDLVRPHIYDELLPRVQQLMGEDSKIKVSDIFIRRYGLDEVSGEARHGISAHFDVFSQVTSVIALDDVASEGTSGLYTTVYNKNQNENENVHDHVHNLPLQNGSTSNHVALRRYFPLNSGDGVVHTWDVLHGVDILPGMDRTSLIVWFDSDDDDDDDQKSQANKGKSPTTTTCSPWLLNDPEQLETNDIAQFVLASALESSTSPPLPSNEEDEQQPSCDDMEQSEQVEYQKLSTCESVMNLIDDGTDTARNASEIIQQQQQQQQHPHDFYLKSASLGNAFALSRLGSLCEEQALSPERAIMAMELLEQLSPNNALSDLPSFFHQQQKDGGIVDWVYMARRFWFESSIRGNPKAQLALGDEVMEQAVVQQNQDLRLVAAVLFGLAAQQNQESAHDLLSSVVDFEMSPSGTIQSEEDFHKSPIVQTAQAAMLAL